MDGWMDEWMDGWMNGWIIFIMSLNLMCYYKLLFRMPGV